MSLRYKTRNDSNRHFGVSSVSCSCGLVHDDELSSRGGIRQEIINLLGGRCSNADCRWTNDDGSLGCKDPDLLEIDHVYDDGFLSRRKNKKHNLVASLESLCGMLRQIKSGSDRYQLLCSCCHRAKTRKRPKWLVGIQKYDRDRRKNAGYVSRTKARVDDSDVYSKKIGNKIVHPEQSRGELDI